jgi:hypothetical protein
MLLHIFTFSGQPLWLLLLSFKWYRVSCIMSLAGWKDNVRKKKRFEILKITGISSSLIFWINREFNSTRCMLACWRYYKLLISLSLFPSTPFLSHPFLYLWYSARLSIYLSFIFLIFFSFCILSLSVTLLFPLIFLLIESYLVRSTMAITLTVKRRKSRGAEKIAWSDGRNNELKADAIAASCWQRL